MREIPLGTQFQAVFCVPLTKHKLLIAIKKVCFDIISENHLRTTSKNMMGEKAFLPLHLSR